MSGVGFRFRVCDLGLGVAGVGFRVWGLGFRIQELYKFLSKAV